MSTHSWITGRAWLVAVVVAVGMAANPQSTTKTTDDQSARGGLVLNTDAVAKEVGRPDKAPENKRSRHEKGDHALTWMHRKLKAAPGNACRPATRTEPAPPQQWRGQTTSSLCWS